MASSSEADKDAKGATSKNFIDLYDGADDLLDYGDTYDLDADLLGTDLANVEDYDEFDLGVDDEFAIDAAEELFANTNSEHSKAQEPNNTSNGKLATDDAMKDRNSGSSNDPTESTSSALLTQDTGTRNSSNGIQPSSQNQQRNENYGEQNRQVANGRQPYSTAASLRGGPGRGGMRSRGQNYMGMGRGNFQGHPGMSHHNMMGMNMGMGMGMAMGRGGVNGAMGQNMNMGVNMNMNMPMQMMSMGMGMGMGPRFPRDNFGNQGMMYPYGSGQGMDGGRMNPGMGGMNVRGPGMGVPGRTIHINPNFQKHIGTPGVPGISAASSQQPYQQQRLQPQDTAKSQTRTWESSSSEVTTQIARLGTHDVRDDDRHEKNQRYSERDDGRSGYDRSSSTSKPSSDHGDRHIGDSYRPSARTDNDGGLSTTGGISGRLSGGMPRRSQSPSISRSTGSIANRLTPGLKRSGEGLEDSSKSQKLSGESTPRSEESQSLNADRDPGSVSFLRREPPQSSRESGDRGASAEPKGFVKMENVPEALSDESIRRLADGISGVDRVLSISKKGGRTVTLGFASVDEAKFFRRQINRTTIEGSLVTVTLSNS
ncbi:hypothetical protein BC939DRAFT_500726 [Gamsiella multidivaricata]|uniref:uncharacterized protein n=1 Tax=Gamsiella multidivaricata TaxID=101098 RepID=UPI00221F8540|nr:uncharacterized protein BC939DRAFT_500726 [Gamsiella multidivaricata]KAG0367354.1 hypothetical protein BGZ54_003983 [Gamsiella multidivaricata]KAI7828616.1 hypothetical protein BC939DRAFT_500726 [Gamsiella multidivaricata]